MTNPQQMGIDMTDVLEAVAHEMDAVARLIESIDLSATTRVADLSPGLSEMIRRWAATVERAAVPGALGAGMVEALDEQRRAFALHERDAEDFARLDPQD